MKISLNLADRIYVHRRGLHAAYAAIGVVLLVLTLINTFHVLNHRRETVQLQERLDQLQQRSAELQRETGDFNTAAYQRLVEEIAFANSILERDAFRWTDLLDRLELLVPEGVSLRSILPDHKNRALNITAVARGLDEMMLLLDRLAQSESLRNVYLLRQEAGKMSDPGGRERETIVFYLVVREAF
jgi:type IV pilus assembly protein PilN